MVLPLVALGAAGIGAIGSIAGGFLNSHGQSSANKANRDIARETNDANRDIAREQMKFQENMSNSAWQRGMEDMRKAGINPLLAASQGGASSPSGAAVGAVTGAPMQNKFSRVQETVSNALQARLMAEQVDKIKSDVQLNKGLTDAANADALLKVTSAQGLAHGLKGKEVEGKIDESSFGQFLRYLDRIPLKLPLIGK